MRNYTEEELIFGLDIGTRTVIGIVGYKENNKFMILAFESIEHEERAMLDGQIHDIQKVSRAVYEVKMALESRLNVKLKDAAIAAAGRALNTQIVSVENTYDDIQEFTLTDVHNLELYGVEKAKEEQQKLSANMDYFCVAYSVINYYLDGYIITNLEGHKGTSIGAKIIATFLPKLVIDSLYAVTERAGLKVVNLTLEPIAAINAVIPDNLRLLNLALVDIGAGTSDIAITRGGSVIAYGMIPIAGDEVTEAILHKYLVDFHTAEKIKQQLTVSGEITFEDILGISYQVTAEEVKRVILPTLDHLTQNISRKILELNGENAPNAVFCVGGGSQMVSVTENIAMTLGLPEQRVAVRTAEHVTQVIDNIGIINGPQMITPLGICLTSMQDRYSQFTTITLNHTKIELLNAKKLTILDAIVAAGIEHTDIFPKKGKTLMFKLNGERIRVKGQNGTPATLLLNGKAATINDSICEGDMIQVEIAAKGMDGEASLNSYIKDIFAVHVNGKLYTIPLIKVNDVWETAEYEIKDQDTIEIISPKSVGELLGYLSISCKDKILTVNFNQVTEAYTIKEGDSILVDEVHTVGEEQEIHESKLEEDSPVANQKTKADECIFLTVNKEVVSLQKKDSPYMLASIFDYITFDLTKPQGTIQLVKNGLPAALTDNLFDGDTLEIYWKK